MKRINMLLVGFAFLMAMLILTPSNTRTLEETNLEDETISYIKENNYTKYNLGIPLQNYITNHAMEIIQVGYETPFVSMDESDIFGYSDFRFSLNHELEFNNKYNSYLVKNNTEYGIILEYYCNSSTMFNNKESIQISLDGSISNYDLSKNLVEYVMYNNNFYLVDNDLLLKNDNNFDEFTYILNAKKPTFKIDSSYGYMYIKLLPKDSSYLEVNLNILELIPNKTNKVTIGLNSFVNQYNKEFIAQAFKFRMEDM